MIWLPLLLLLWPEAWLFSRAFGAALRLGSPCMDNSLQSFTPLEQNGYTSPDSIGLAVAVAEALSLAVKPRFERCLETKVSLHEPTLSPA